MLKNIGNSDHISAWKSKLLSDESIKLPGTYNHSLSPALNYINSKILIKYDGTCLKQDKFKCIHKTVVNIYIVYEIDL